LIDLELITHAWNNPDGSTPDGRVVFVLSSSTEAVAEDTSITTQPINVDLITGYMTVELAPNVNADLTPDGTFYWVREEIVGSTPDSYPITVPTGGPWDLYALRQAS
jgi:hypothetical protein